jgi:uncharacterized protein YaaN involved in tellurite resistance
MDTDGVTFDFSIEKNEENVEIEVSNKSKTKKGYQFTRVNFDDPTTIHNYGADIESQISEVFLSTQEMLPDESYYAVDEGKLKELSSFDSKLEAIEKQKSGDMNLMNRFLIKLYEILYKGEKSDKKVSNSYKEQYKIYMESLDEIFETVESQIKAGEEEFGLMKEVVGKLIPLVEALDEVIKIGYKDKEDFESQLEELKTREDLDLETQIKLETYPQVISVFFAKLIQLEKNYITYKNMLLEYCLQANQGTTIIEVQKSFLTTKPVLTAQGSLKIINKVQQTRIENMEKLNNSLNAIISGNAEQIGKNAKAIHSLQLKQGISTDTLKALDTSVKSGIKVIKESLEARNQRHLIDKKAIDELNAHTAEYQNKLLLINSGERTESEDKEIEHTLK